MSAVTAAPSIGDRVEIDVTYMGQTIPLEVRVVAVDHDADGVRIITAPDGALVTRFARREWRDVSA